MTHSLRNATAAGVLAIGVLIMLGCSQGSATTPSNDAPIATEAGVESVPTPASSTAVAEPLGEASDGPLLLAGGGLVELGGLDNLRVQFNRDGDTARLLLLMSPT